MEKFVTYVQYVVIGVYAFNSVSYLYLRQGNKALYWLAAAMLGYAVVKMR